MARFVRVGSWTVLDKKRILDVVPGNTLFTKKPILRIKYYNEFKHENEYTIRPMWDWTSIKFMTVSERDDAYEKIKQFIPENVAETFIIEEL